MTEQQKVTQKVSDVTLVAFAVFTKTGVVAVRKSRPKLRSGEWAVLLRFRVPASVFAPTLAEVSVTIPESAVISPVIEIVATPQPGNPQ